MTKDVHGYSELLAILDRVENELRDAYDSKNADAIAMASKFSIGSPSEFLGEARIALKEALSTKAHLSSDTIDQIESTIEYIDEGFRRVGG